MNTHQKTRLRVIVATTAVIGSLVLGGTTSAGTTPTGHSVVKTVRVGEQQALCRHGDNDCSVAAVLTARNGAGGRITYR